MTGLSSAGEAAVLTPLITNAYVSLHTADPGDAGASEVSGNAYARIGPISFSNSGSNPTVSSNTAIVTYAAATGSWGTVGYFGLWTALSGGTFQGSGALATPKAVSNGDTARFLAGALTVTVQ